MFLMFEPCVVVCPSRFERGRCQSNICLFIIFWLYSCLVYDISYSTVTFKGARVFWTIRRFWSQDFLSDSVLFLYLRVVKRASNSNRRAKESHWQWMCWWCMCSKWWMYFVSRCVRDCSLLFMHITDNCRIWERVSKYKMGKGVFCRYNVDWR